MKRALIFVHRWLGVALSLVFLLWFVSGFVMMYRGFPAIGARDRLPRSAVLNPAQIQLSPEDALAVLAPDEPPAQMRLTSFDGRPAYEVVLARRTKLVYADDGTEQLLVDAAMIDRAAAAWAGRPLNDARKAAVEEIDQWTVAGELRSLRPLYKYSWPDGQQVYVNGDTAAVVQYTTTESRFWAYLGAIPHWLYYTPLRKHQAQWFSFVVFLSLMGTVGACLGVVLICWTYSPRKRFRYAGAPTSIPYRGWKRWHAIAGLCFGLVTMTWAFSGLLSMGPFPIVERLTELTVSAQASRERGGGSAATESGQETRLIDALRGSDALSASSFAGKTPGAAIAAVPDFDVRQLELSSFAGDPIYLATNGRGETRIVPVRGEPRTTFEADAVMRVVRAAIGPALAELRVMTEYDAYYLDRRQERPLPVIVLRLNDAAGTRHYIDPGTGRIVGTYSARHWVNRWLYHGLHSLDFPWLYRYPPLWDIVVIALLLGGTALCVTSIVLTWRVLARTLAPRLRARLRQPDEDLALEPKL